MVGLVTRGPYSHGTAIFGTAWRVIRFSTNIDAGAKYLFILGEGVSALVAEIIYSFILVNSRRRSSGRIIY